MMAIRQMICVSGALLLLVLTATGVQADDGRSIFHNRCGACHTAGGEAPVFAPIKFAAIQWQRFFERNTHARKQDISADFTEAELERVQRYLMDHAADADRPVAIGLR